MSTWVLLRGLMRDTRHWGDFQKQFHENMDPDNLVALDFPGNGSLHAQKSPANVKAMVSHARGHLQQLGFAPPFRVLALSFGAMVAVAWSEQYPVELERLVLINTSLAPYSLFYHRLRPGVYPVIPLLLYGSISQRENLILKLTSTRYHAKNKQDILKKWISYAEECPITQTNIVHQLMAATSLRASWHIPAVPVLLLAGKQDQLVNAKCSLALAQKWRCAIRLHPTAGHDLPLDDGEWVIQKIKAWLHP